MMLRWFLIIILMFSISLSNIPLLIAENNVQKKYEDIVPTPIEIDEVYRTNPFLIYRIVQRMYLLEQIKPVLTLPKMNFYCDKKNNLHIQYKNPILLSLGDGALQYHFKISPQIVYGFKKEKENKGFSKQMKILITVGVFVVGFLIGAKTGFSISR